MHDRHFLFHLLERIRISVSGETVADVKHDNVYSGLRGANPETSCRLTAFISIVIYYLHN